MDHKLHRHLGKLPIIVCECGEEILVVPDVKEMARCIEAHALVHSQKVKDILKSEEEYTRIEEQLTQKVIIEISKKADKTE